MPAAAIEMLQAFDEGRAILINLVDGHTSGALAKSDVLAFLNGCREIALRKPRVGEWGEVRNSVYDVIWSAPEKFQFAGPPTALTTCLIAAVRPFRTVRRLVKQGKSIAGHVPCWAALNLDYANEEDLDDAACVQLAHEITVASAADDSFTLNVRDSYSGVYYPAWFSRRDLLESLLDGVSSDQRAQRARDWLGLPASDDRTPLFAFMSIEPLDDLPGVLGVDIARPTVLDAISSEFFKHRCHLACTDLDGWGRCLDFALAAPSALTDIDGGPEAVVGHFAGQSMFECRYLGRPKSPSPFFDKQTVEVLLGERAFGSVLAPLLALTR